MTPMERIQSEHKPERVSKASRKATKTDISHIWLALIHISNSVRRSSELNVASLFMLHSETFGLCVTVISTAFSTLALSPVLENNSALPFLVKGDSHN